MALSTLLRSGCLQLHTLSRQCVCRHSTWPIHTQLRSLPPLWHPQPFHSTARCSASSDSSSSSGASTSSATSSKPPVQFNVRRLTKNDVECSFARSGGAGGQNVNKVNTKVDMRFDLDGAAWIPDEVKEVIKRVEKNRFTKDGILVVNSTRHRTQSDNIDDALEKLQEMIDRAIEAATPKEADPETVKRVKANIKAGNERRLDTKKKSSAKKQERRRKDFD